MAAKQKSAAEKSLEALAKQTPDKPVSLRAQVQTLGPSIAALVQKGHSWKRIAEALGRGGVTISHHTLRQYFRASKTAAKEGSMHPPAPNSTAAQLRTVEASASVDKTSLGPVRAKRGYSPILPGDDDL